jgi:glutamate 5-kinase
MARKKIVVIKIGSSTLTTKQGILNQAAFLPFVQSIVPLRENYDFVIISSGAVAAGRGIFNQMSAKLSVTDRQAFAALGQGRLIQTWNEAFGWYGIHVGQLLLTRHDLSFKESYQNILGCINALLERGIVPIINENDSVKVRSTNFGDNDMLGAMIAALIHADKYIIVTDTPGLYNKNPAEYPDAKLIQYGEEVTPEVLQMAGGSNSQVGTGGMRTKLQAVRRASSQGIECFIGVASKSDFLEGIINGDGQGTYFGSRHGVTLSRKKQWMLFHSEISGSICIDPGAQEALIKRGKSLLPVGIKSVEGDFPLGSMINVYNETQRLLGRGRTAYSSEQLKKVLGTPSSDAKRHANSDREEVIHRDDWVAIQE